jgi:hypothetical protein
MSRKIVAKVDQLIALVDQLETQLAASRATAAILIAALVAELHHAMLSFPRRRDEGLRGPGQDRGCWWPVPIKLIWRDLNCCSSEAQRRSSCSVRLKGLCETDRWGLPSKPIRARDSWLADHSQFIPAIIEVVSVFGLR